MRTAHGKIRVGVAGLGTIGKSLVTALDAGVPGLTLSAVAARDRGAAEEWLKRLNTVPPVVEFPGFPESCDLVVESAPSHHLRAIAEPVLSAGKILVPLSVGALLENMDLIDLASRSGGQIIVPTGALLGLDAVTAAAEGVIHSVKMVTRKPIKGLEGARIFKGSAREAARGFPANLNVAVALSLAGIGPDLTELEIWVVPGLERNVHTISVDSDSARFTMTIENIPTENPRTGRITAQSVLALLRKMAAPLRVGT
jgi:aspartate dehydrogenase